MPSSRAADSIATLVGQEVRPHEVAKGIGQGKDFGCPTTFRFSNSLIFESPFGAVSVTVGRNDRNVDHRIFHVRLIRHRFEYPLEHALPRPVVEALEDRVPVAELMRQIPSGAVGACFPMNRLQKQAVVTAAATGVAILAKAMGSHLLSLGVRQAVRIIFKLLKRSLHHHPPIDET